MKVRAQSTKNECSFVLQNVPLSSIASIKELKAYLRLHLNLGVVTAVRYFYKGRKKIWLQTNEELTQLVGKKLSHGKGTLWCEAASHANEHTVDFSVNSGEEDLTDDQGEEIQPKKKTKSLANEKRDRERLVDELKVKHGVQFSGPQYQL